MIEICAVGGYDEIGRNMTAIKIDDEVIICDMGIHLENFIRYTEDEDTFSTDRQAMIDNDAVPDINFIKHWKSKVKAILSTHAHLDHIGGIPYLAGEFDCPVVSTPFACAVLNDILKNERIRIPNRIIPINPNSTYVVSKNISVEFIDMTHSTPQTAMLAIHTKYGTIIYSNDFKFDMYPGIGKKPDFEKLQRIGDKGVICLITDSTYAYDEKKTPSEAVAKQMLKDVMLGTDATGHIIVATTFASHLARLKSIIEMGKKLDRKIVFLGRSLAKYIGAGEEVGIIDFSSQVEIIGYRKKIDKWLSNLKDNMRSKYLVVVTGHQGEPKSVLSRLATGTSGFRFYPDDHVIFSCTTIPAEINIKNRKVLEEALKKRKVRLFKDIHVSGHAAREDLRDLINFLRPKHIIPAHGERFMTEALKDLANSMGYRNVHLLDDKECVTIVK